MGITIENMKVVKIFIISRPLTHNLYIALIAKHYSQWIGFKKIFIRLFATKLVGVITFCFQNRIFKGCILTIYMSLKKI